MEGFIKFKKENRFKVSLRLLSLIVVCALLMAVFEPVAIAEDKSIDSESKPMEQVELSLTEKLDQKGVDFEKLPANIQRIAHEATISHPNGRAVFKSVLDETSAPDDLNCLRVEDDEGGNLYIFAEPIKYKNAQGELQWIDTSMKPTQDNGDYVYQNAANSFTAKFGRDATIGIKMDDAFTWHPVGDNALFAKATLQEARAGNGHITYPYAFGKDTTLEYLNTATGVKENIVLEQPTKQNRFSFQFTSSTHIPVLAKDKKSIDVMTAEGEIAYQFSPLVIYDSYVGEDDGFAHYTDNAWYELKRDTNGVYQITYVLNPEWLNSPEVVWPVVIDPYLNEYMPNGSNNVIDTYVDQNYPDVVYSRSSTSMKIGIANNKEILSYIKFKTITLNSTKGIQYDGAIMGLYFLPDVSNDGLLTCRRVTSDWTSGNVNYNTRPSTTANYSTTEWPDLNDDNKPYFVIFDVSNIVALWLENKEPNHGFQISKSGASAWLRTCENSISGERPFLCISYTQVGQILPDNSVYYIKSLYSGKYMTAGSVNQGNNTYKVTQENFTGNTNQQWKLSYLKNTALDKVNNSGYYHVEPQDRTNYRLMLPTYDPGNGEDMTVQPAGNAGEERQAFRFIRCTPTFMVYRIQHGRGVYSGLDVEGPSTAAGAPIQVWSYEKVSQQYFVLEKVEDTRGLVNGKSYYIKNVLHDKYLDVSNGSDVNNTPVIGYSYNGANNQKWKLILCDQNLYKLIPGSSPTGKTLNITGNNVNIYTDNHSSYQKFTIVRQEELLYGRSGVYYIKYGSKYLSLKSDGYTLELTDSPDNYYGSSQWSFERVDKGDADIYTHSETGAGTWSTTAFNNVQNNFKNNCSSMGYSSYSYHNISSINALNWLKSDHIWVHCGHGAPGFICFTNDNGQTFNSNIYYYDIDDFNENELAGLRCFITIGCSAGSYSGNHNLIDSVYNKGAQFALGWTNTTTNPIVEWWLQRFFNYSAAGNTVKASIEAADIYAGIPEVGTGYKYYRGDDTQRLSR